METAAHEEENQCHGNDEKDVDNFCFSQEFVEVIHCFLVCSNASARPRYIIERAIRCVNVSILSATGMPKKSQAAARLIKSDEKTVINAVLMFLYRGAYKVNW